MSLLTIPVTVKKKDGSINKHSVIRNNILHKTLRHPSKVREALIQKNHVKVNIASGEDVCF